VRGANYWKRYLSDNMFVRNADIKKIDHMLNIFAGSFKKN